MPTFRSSQRRFSIKKLLLKISPYSQESTCSAVFFLISCQCFKKEAPTQVPSHEYSKIFKNTYFQEHLRTAVSVVWKMKKWQIENSEKSKISEILEKLFQVFLFPSFRFCPTAKIENSDLKFLEKDFRDFRGFWVFDLDKIHA